MQAALPSETSNQEYIIAEELPSVGEEELLLSINDEPMNWFDFLPNTDASTPDNQENLFADFQPDPEIDTAFFSSDLRADISLSNLDFQAETLPISDSSLFALADEEFSPQENEMTEQSDFFDGAQDFMWAAEQDTGSAFLSKRGNFMEVLRENFVAAMNILETCLTRSVSTTQKNSFLN